MISAQKERIRGSNFAVFVTKNNGVPMEEALRLADEAGLVIASSKRLNKAVILGEGYENFEQDFIFWSGTMVAHDAPDKKLEKTIECVDPETKLRYVFHVPEEHIGKKNMAFVSEHPEFTLEKDGNNRIFVPSELGVVAFPTQTGYYLGDSKYDIPTGGQVDGSKNSHRYLIRIEKRVGFVARDNYLKGQIVSLSDQPSSSLGVVVEATDSGATKKLQVDAALSGILIRGISLDELKVLVVTAGTNVSELSQMVRPEKLEAMRKLLQALDIYSSN